MSPAPKQIALRACRMMGGAAMGALRLVKRIPFRLRRRRADDTAAASAWPTAELDPAAPPVEAVHQHLTARRARIVGVVGVDHDSGVSTLVHALAARCAQGGQRTLVIDCGGRACASDQSGPNVLGGGAARAAEPHAGGYDTLLLRPPSHEMLRVRSVSWLRHLMVSELSEYQMIFIDMLPAREDPEYALPATIVGNACDLVLLMCLAAQATKADLEEALTSLRTVGAPLGGVVINRREQPTLGFEIAREAKRIAWIAPRLANRLATKAQNSRFLDVHA
ncbi:MAG: putative ATPase [Hyphomicrobiales bacterium]|nr:putative ATPase [Hyphomicrobiales bacterium]